jgi:acetyl-CoA synthetase
MSTTNLFPVPEATAKSAWLDEAGYFKLYHRSVDDPEGFWREQAKRIAWTKQPT